MSGTQPVVISSPEQWPPADLGGFFDPEVPPQQYQTADGLHFVADPACIATVESTNTYGYRSTYLIAGTTSLFASGVRLGERKTVEGSPDPLLPLEIAPGLIANIGARSLSGVRVVTTEEIKALQQQGKLLTAEIIDEIDKFDLI